MGIIKQLAILSTVASLAAAVSCDKNDEWPTPNPGRGGRIEVRIAAPATRTAIDENTLATRWVKGDRMVLWSYANGTAAFENVPFTLWYPRESPDEGLFTGMVDAMEAGTYDYYAAYPTPEAAAGTKVSYTIPAVQNGAWNPALDIMLAATQGAELREEILNEVTLHFYHKVHALKITIPEGRNLLGKPIRKLRIDFPQPVAGRMTWDLTAPEAAPEMQDATSAITLDFAEPADAGDTFWVFLAPADLTGGEVKFTATDGTEFSWPLSTGSFRDCNEGRITPVKLTIGEIRPQQEFRLTVDPAHLGEEVTQIDYIEMPEGYQIPALEPENTICRVVKNPDGTFSIRVFEDQTDFLTDGMEVGLSVGSENTEGVYGKRCALSRLTADGCTVAAPYLLFEDFHEIGDHSTSSAADLSDWGLPNWSGAQAHTDPWNCIVATCHVSSHSGISDSRTKGRVDTSRLPIRNGKTVDVKVSFDMGYNNHSGVEGSKAVATCTFGRTDTTEKAIDADAGFTQTVFSERHVSKLSDTRNLPDKLTDQAVAGCNSSSRLSWQIYTYKSSGWSAVTNVYYDCYIDNIRVTIVH